MRFGVGPPSHRTMHVVRPFIMNPLHMVSLGAEKPWPQYTRSPKKQPINMRGDSWSCWPAHRALWLCGSGTEVVAGHCGSTGEGTAQPHALRSKPAVAHSEDPELATSTSCLFSLSIPLIIVIACSPQTVLMVAAKTSCLLSASWALEGLQKCHLADTTELYCPSASCRLTNDGTHGEPSFPARLLNRGLPGTGASGHSQ